jgi:ABC-2 type transport system ATP-binding protein
MRDFLTEATFRRNAKSGSLPRAKNPRPAEYSPYHKYMHAINIQGITKSYSGKRVLDGISLQLASGRFYALIGQNGSGKSTLMRILMKLEGPDSGDGTVAGFRLSEDSGDFFRTVGYASESVLFSSWMPVLDIVRKLRPLYPAWDESSFSQMAADLGIDLNARYKAMSRGQRMQVCMAFAFAICPKVLLLDEITAVLDPRARSYIIRRCKNFVDRGGTVVMATNIVSEIQPVANALIYIESNKIRLVSEITEISSQFIKLRKRYEDTHLVFEHPDCSEIRIADDGSITCLIPVASYPEAIPEECIYSGRATAEDVFIYFTQRGQRNPG